MNPEWTFPVLIRIIEYNYIGRLYLRQIYLKNTNNKIEG